MSRRLMPSHRRTSSAAETRPYKPTTLPHTCTNLRGPSNRKHHHSHNGYQQSDTGLSDDTLTDSQSYYDNRRRSFSDDSGSTSVPFHDNESRRSRYYASDRSCGRKTKDKIIYPSVHKDRKVYAKEYVPCEGAVYQEISPQIIPENPSASKPSRLSDRSQSVMSSGVNSAIVDGCGGKCQTFENVCYFVLQLIFMMCILIGVSLCIAGLVLRKSAARNLQVLVYIGALLAIVSGLLLGIQLNARISVKKRKLAVRNAKRAPIPLETLMPRTQQTLVAVQEGQRVVPQVLRPLPPQNDEQGIPWWRRKEIV